MVHRARRTGASFALLFALAATLPAAAQQPKPKELRIAAASDLQAVLPKLAGEYESAHHVKLTISYGSSATLEQQIETGAPFDLFLSADYLFPERVVAAKLADTPAPIPYARGTLVLWARKDSPLQPITGNTLYDARLTRLAIANPLHAPYGRAAEAALKRLGVDGKLKDKIVTAENVAQAAQFADSGNAQAAMTSLTLALSDHYQQAGTYVRIPTVSYPEIRQCAAVLKNSPNRDAAHAFLQWLTSEPIQTQLQKLGLDPAH